MRISLKLCFAAAAFAAIPGAQVLHLHHNKHELTFMLTGS